MPDYRARKRLKQKVLERWENEGGRIETADLTKAHERNPTRDNQGQGNHLSPSRSNFTPSSASTSPTKKRKPPKK